MKFVLVALWSTLILVHGCKNRHGDSSQKSVEVVNAQGQATDIIYKNPGTEHVCWNSCTQVETADDEETISTQCELIGAATVTEFRKVPEGTDAKAWEQFVSAVETDTPTTFQSPESDSANIMAGVTSTFGKDDLEHCAQSLLEETPVDEAKGDLSLTKQYYNYLLKVKNGTNRPAQYVVQMQQKETNITWTPAKSYTIPPNSGPNNLRYQQSVYLGGGRYIERKGVMKGFILCDGWSTSIKPKINDKCKEVGSHPYFSTFEKTYTKTLMN
ncbi:MAG: hypothetical protein AB7T49_02875 [Oligoflexales bacterium]